MKDFPPIELLGGLWQELKTGALYLSQNLDRRSRSFYSRNSIDHETRCLNPLSLYFEYRRFHKWARVNIEEFFFGWLDVFFDRDWYHIREALKIIWADDDRAYYRITNYLGLYESKNWGKVMEAIRIKAGFLRIMDSPGWKKVERIGACQIFESERKERLERFIKRLDRFAREKREFSRTDLLQRFSDKKLGEIADLLNQYREERPGFRYPSQWLDDLASKKKGIRVTESYVQALRNYLEEAEREKRELEESEALKKSPPTQSDNLALLKETPNIN
jgi:hypothetical protein